MTTLQQPWVRAQRRHLLQRVQDGHAPLRVAAARDQHAARALDLRPGDSEAEASLGRVKAAAAYAAHMAKGAEAEKAKETFGAASPQFVDPQDMVDQTYPGGMIPNPGREGNSRKERSC